jgi:hypothetical protein
VWWATRWLRRWLTGRGLSPPTRGSSAALNDEGAPVYDHDNAAALATLGIPAFACTPDLFPQLMAAAIERRDLGVWAGEHDIVTARAEPRRDH